MLAPQPIPGIYPANHYFYPNVRGPLTTSVFVDVNWTLSWPTIRTIVLGSFMIISSAAIVGLDIANLAIEGTKDAASKFFGLGTAKVGAGIWSGSISFIAAVLIVTISMKILFTDDPIKSLSLLVFVRNKRAAATVALIATILAFLFSIVLVGLTANAIQINQYDAYGLLVETKQYKLLIAILSLAAWNVTLCLVFFAMYISIFLSSSTRRTVKY